MLQAVLSSATLHGQHHPGPVLCYFSLAAGYIRGLIVTEGAAGSSELVLVITSLV